MKTPAASFAIAALTLSLGTVGAYVGLIAALSTPLPPMWYLGMLGLSALLGVVAVWRARRWLTVSALAVTVLLLGFASYFHFVAMRVPATPTQLAVGQPAPDFALPDAAGRSVRLSDYRGRQPVVLVFYRGYW